METHLHDMTNLFAQLGLASDGAAIERFIDTHGPLPSSTQLSEAAWWSSAQADFLREEVLIDADWCDVIDTLDSRMRERTPQFTLSLFTTP